MRAAGRGPGGAGRSAPPGGWNSTKLTNFEGQHLVVTARRLRTLLARGSEVSVDKPTRMRFAGLRRVSVQRRDPFCRCLYVFRGGSSQNG